MRPVRAAVLRICAPRARPSRTSSSLIARALAWPSPAQPQSCLLALCEPPLPRRAAALLHPRRFVEKRLLEQKVQALSGQIDERDRLESSIEARIFSLFGRLQQLEDTNLRLEVQHESRAEAVGVA